MQCVYCASMAKTIQVRDVADDVHKQLRVKAARAGLSLSEYLRREVTLLAKRPSLDEFFDRLATRADVPVNSDEIVAALAAERRTG